MNENNTEKNRRILIIDDNPSIHDDLRKILYGPGAVNSNLAASKAVLFGAVDGESPLMDFEIDSAYQGQEGLAMAGAAAESGRPYALAFIDIRMPPGWDGIETISHLWQSDKDLQVVICTAYSDYTWEEAIRKLGRSANLLVLKKPFDNIEVLQLADALTEKWALTAQLRRRMHSLDQMVKERTVELERANEALKKEMAEQAKLENQLRQSQKMEAIGQLAGGVAHDFNNILAATLMHLGLLQESPQLTENVKGILSEVETETIRAANLTRQLLLFSRRGVAEIQPLDLNGLVSNLLKMLRRLLGENIEVKYPDSAHAMWVRADAGMMEQVVMNLCINARDAMPKGGRLIIATTMVELSSEDVKSDPSARPGSFVCLSVTDTGCGMDEAVLKRIFEPFFTTKEVGKGTGLGLATVYGIVKQHESWIEVKSEVGRGSSFQVYLPAVPTPLNNSARSSAAEEICGGSETILVVEDELALRRPVALGLRKLGYAVLEAGNGLEAQKAWEQNSHKIELLLTDMVMPENMTGLDLALRLRKDKGSLKVIISSGYSADLLSSSSVVPEIAFLPKPYRVADLAKTVRRCLDRI